MYAIIYWRGEDEVYPVLMADGQIKVYDKLAEADADAEEFEKRLKVDARVINCDSVHE